MQGDLISRSAALEKMGKLPLCWEYGQAVAECWGIVNDLPAVDAVPVVRCKDCKHRCTEQCPMFIKEYAWEWDGFDVDYVDLAVDNGFCHRGEKKG